MFNFLKRKKVSVVGIDVGSSSIKVVQLALKGKQPVLETYGELALGPYANIEIGQSATPTPEKVTEALKDLLRESHVATGLAAASIPYGASLISIIEMPTLSEKQLAQMIPLEARKYIPVPLIEVILDWSVLPRSTSAKTAPQPAPQTGAKGAPAAASAAGPAPTASSDANKSDVLLVAIHKDTISRYEQILSDAGVEPGFFEIEIFSGIRSILDETAPNHMVLDIGAAASKVYVVEQGVLRVSHVINHGAQDITVALSKKFQITFAEAELLKRNLAQIAEPKRSEALKVVVEAVMPILMSAHKVVLSYQKRYGSTISEMTIVGGGARTAGILELAQNEFQTKVSLGNPFFKTESPAFLEPLLKTTGPEFAVAVGLALRKLQESQ